LGDKFLDLINPSETPSEVIDLSEAEFLLIDESFGFTEEELETLSNDELIEIAKEKGLEDILVLDADGNLQNRDEVIKALVESYESGGFTEEELEVLSNDELIEIAKEKGLEDKLALDSDGNLQNRDEVIKALVENETLKESATQELESLSDDALIEIAEAKGMDSITISEELENLSNDELIEIAKEKGLEDTLVLDADGNLQNRDEVIKALTDNLIILDEDGNLQNKDEIIEALVEGTAKTKAAALELENSGIPSTLYFGFDDTEIDEVATRVIIKHANFMQNNPSFRLRLEGHADERGTREYNLALGENRALSVKEVLGLYNLEDRVIVVSYGEERPVAIEHNEEAWEKNRRVEFVYY
jgi:peptidoglycan-associated lipoprotein